MSNSIGPRFACVNRGPQATAPRATVLRALALQPPPRGDCVESPMLNRLLDELLLGREAVPN